MAIFAVGFWILMMCFLVTVFGPFATIVILGSLFLVIGLFVAMCGG